MISFIFSLIIISYQTNVQDFQYKKPADQKISRWLRYPKEHNNFDYSTVDYRISYKGISKNPDIEQLINYAYSKGQSLEFVQTLNMENGNRDHTLQSREYQNGVREQSFGICQINRKYHSRFLDSKEFKNPYYQIDYCRELWLDGQKKGTMPFNAFRVRGLRSNDLVLIK